MQTRKQKVYLTDDMKHRIVREADRSKTDKVVADRYNVSASNVSRWRKEGFGTAAPTPKNGDHKVVIDAADIEVTELQAGETPFKPRVEVMKKAAAEASRGSMALRIVLEMVKAGTLEVPDAEEVIRSMKR